MLLRTRLTVATPPRNPIENSADAINSSPPQSQQAPPFHPEEVVAPNSPLPSDIPITRRGFCLLGCPVGPPDYCEEVFRDRLAKVRVSLVALRDMGDSQLETILLRSCLALPKVSFVLRACPPSAPTHICQAATDFDRALREPLESIVSGLLSDWSWLKASLPSSLGGLNLRSASLHAPAAFLAACSSSQSLVEGLLGHPRSPSPHTSPAVSALATAAARPEWQCLDDIDVPLRQRMLSHSIDEAPSSPGSVICSASCRRLAQRGANTLPGSPSPG